VVVVEEVEGAARRDKRALCLSEAVVEEVTGSSAGVIGALSVGLDDWCFCSGGALRLWKRESI